MLVEKLCNLVKISTFMMNVEIELKSTRPIGRKLGQERRHIRIAHQTQPQRLNAMVYV